MLNGAISASIAALNCERMNSAVQPLKEVRNPCEPQWRLYSVFSSLYGMAEGVSGSMGIAIPDRALWVGREAHPHSYKTWHCMQGAFPTSYCNRPAHPSLSAQQFLAAFRRRAPALVL